MLAKRLRFHGHGSLRFLYKNADAFRSKYFTLKAMTHPRRTTSRFSVIVSKKVHKSAVGRNRIRRRMYEIIRQDLTVLNGSYDIAIIITSGEVLAADYSEMQKTYRELLHQAGIVQ
ncbi:ribonuclease P protein component [Candidatus Saccharibacteria bacterium]|nr:ribonuclease P protein component [Candidatus Saccharibacteria bacterium]